MQHLVQETFDHTASLKLVYGTKVDELEFGFSLWTSTERLTAEFPDAGTVTLADGMKSWGARSGSANIQLDDDSAVVTFSNLVLGNVSDPTAEDTRAGGPFSGTVTGRVERACWFIEASLEGVRPANESGEQAPLVRLVADPNWTSDFCASRR